MNEDIPAYAIFRTRKVGVAGKRKDARMATKRTSRVSAESVDERLTTVIVDVRASHSAIYDRLGKLEWAERGRQDSEKRIKSFAYQSMMAVLVFFAIFGVIHIGIAIFG